MEKTTENKVSNNSHTKKLVSVADRLGGVEEYYFSKKLRQIDEKVGS